MHKINGVLRWSQGDQANGFSLTAMAYANDWHASNQIPARGVSEGVISLWGNIDPTDRGDTTRFSLSTRWSETNEKSHTRIEAFAAHTTLDLFNDFDYYLTQPILGDQFRQFDRRTTLGLNLEHGWKYNFLGLPWETRVGLSSATTTFASACRTRFRPCLTRPLKMTRSRRAMSASGPTPP